MKRMASILAILCAAVLFFSGNAFSQEKVDWDAFSKNLIAALKTPNTGVQVSAMQFVIQYADKVNVQDAALDLVKLYRNHKDDRVRQMALVTINAISNEWALGIVKRDYKFERSEIIKRIMAGIVKESKTKSML